MRDHRGPRPRNPSEQVGSESVSLRSGKRENKLGQNASFTLCIIAAVSLSAIVAALLAQRWFGIWWLTIGLGPAIAVSLSLLWLSSRRI